jgi:hypothetical protein
MGHPGFVLSWKETKIAFGNDKSLGDGEKGAGGRVLSGLMFMSELRNQVANWI